MSGSASSQSAGREKPSSSKSQTSFLTTSQHWINFFPGLPSGFCGVYSTTKFAKAKVTNSVSSPPEPLVLTLVISTSLNLYCKNSNGLSPDLLTVSFASGMIVPSNVLE